MAEVSKIGNYRKKGWLLGKSMAEPKWLDCQCLSSHLCIYLSICLSVCLFVHLSIYLSSYRSVDLSIYRSIYLSIYRSIGLSIYRSIDLSIYLSIYLSCYLSDHLSIQPVLRHFSQFTQCKPEKQAFCARLPAVLQGGSLKTKLFCDPFSTFVGWKLENEAILRDFLNYSKLKA